MGRLVAKLRVRPLGQRTSLCFSRPLIAAATLALEARGTLPTSSTILGTTLGQSSAYDMLRPVAATAGSSVSEPSNKPK